MAGDLIPSLDGKPFNKDGIVAKSVYMIGDMPTEYGPVDLRFKPSADGSTPGVSFAGRWRMPPAKLLLHAPPVPGLRNITINGKVVDARA